MKRLLFLLALVTTITVASAQQAIYVYPSPLRVTSPAVGTPVDTVMVFSNATYYTRFVRIAVTGVDADAFILTDSASFTLPGMQGTVSLGIQFKPTHADTSYAQLFISSGSNDSGSGGSVEQTVNLYGYTRGVYNGAGLEIIPKTVQFFNCIVGRTVDAIFTVNNGSVAAKPVVVSFQAPAQSPFTIVSPTSPVTIPPGGYTSCIVRFSPTQEGTFTSEFTVLANGTAQTVPVTATAYRSNLKIEWENGDFVADSIGQPVSRNITVTNNGYDSTVTVFTSRGMAFKAEPEYLNLSYGQSGTSVVTFTPTTIDTVTEALEVTRSRMSEYSLPLVGYVKPKPGVRLFVGDVSGKPGTTSPCVITLMSPLPSAVMSATMQISFNASVLVPMFQTLTDETVNGIRTVTYRTAVPSTRAAGDVLATLPFTIAMGDAKNSRITVSNVVWRGVDDITIPLQTTADDATTSVDDDREVNTNAGTLSMTLQPNPLATTSTCTVYGAKGALLVEVFNSVGVRVYSASLTASAEGTTVVLDRTGLSQGTYLVRAGNGRQTLVRRLVVE